MLPIVGTHATCGSLTRRRRSSAIVFMTSMWRSYGQHRNRDVNAKAQRARKKSSYDLLMRTRTEHRQRANLNSTSFATFASFALLRWGSVFAHPRLKNSRGPRIPLMRSNNKAKSDGRSTKFKFLLFTINTGAALYSWKKRPYATLKRVR